MVVISTIPTISMEFLGFRLTETAASKTQSESIHIQYELDSESGLGVGGQGITVL